MLNLTGWLPLEWASSLTVRFSAQAVSMTAFVVSGGDFFGSYGYWFAHGCAVRPVVSLKSNITVDDIKVVTGKTEETWSRTGGIGYGSGELSGATGMVDGSTGK